MLSKDVKAKPFFFFCNEENRLETSSSMVSVARLNIVSSNSCFSGVDLGVSVLLGEAKCIG